MIDAKFVLVRDADIDENLTDWNYQVALEVNSQEYFYISNHLTKSDAQILADSLNNQNNLIGN